MNEQTVLSKFKDALSEMTLAYIHKIHDAVHAELNRRVELQKKGGDYDTQESRRVSGS